MDFDQGLPRRVADFYARYSECICDDNLEVWPDFFAAECVYKIIPRINYDRGLPISLILAESRGGLVDRMTAIRNTMVFAPRYISHTVNAVRIRSYVDRLIEARSMICVHETLSDQPSRLLLVGRSFDRMEIGEEDLHFVERVVVSDTEALPGTLVYPI
jgi:3-phenylpropionate/cinnamic acid dioxygenase small subunit